MLVEFQVENYRSFASIQKFSMVASIDETHGGALVVQEQFRLLRAAAVYGANASGKSNLLEALGAARHFVLHSATGMNLGDPIPDMIPFRLDPRRREEPCRFDVTVMVEGTRHDYGFAATSERVHSEYLFVRRAGGRTVKRFSRDLDRRTGKTKWTFRGLPAKDAKLLREKTRENGLLLSRAADLNIRAFRDLYLWFRQRLRCFDLSDPPTVLMTRTALRAQKEPEFRDRVLRMLRDADLGIGDFSVQDEPLGAPRPFPEKPRAATTDRLRARLGSRRIAIQTTHLDSADEPVTFSLERDESNGTQRFFSVAGPILEALDSGATVVVDELECSMHPLLTRKLVELFCSPEANGRGAQLVFSTHDSSLMDPSLFRRDQLWLAEKRNSGATELFSLHDFDGGDKPRKGEPFQKQYLTGRYGGVPKFGPVFEDLEVP